MHALIRRAALARKETCQMLNHMGWEGAHCATHKKRVRATLMPGVLFACRFSMAAWLWINDLLMAQKVSCTLHDFVCVRFVPFVYPVVVTGFVFFPLTAPAYACAVSS